MGAEPVALQAFAQQGQRMAAQAQAQRGIVPVDVFLFGSRGQFQVAFVDSSGLQQGAAEPWRGCLP
ncbi:hypothetical protein D3C71_2217280 [compost metagenome]